MLVYKGIGGIDGAEQSESEKARQIGIRVKLIQKVNPNGASGLSTKA